MNRFAALSLAALGGLWLWRKSGANSGPAARLPGTQKDLASLVLETGSMLLQGKSPLQAMNLYLNGFHFYADDMGHQLEAHHYCAALNEDFHQCVIFDGNTRDARLIGVEYIVSERLFRTLPEEERKLWHSHDYEVKSGTLIAAGLPMAAEHELMKKIVRTYGKVWHTWDTQRHDLPMGIPALMMAFTDDGQLRPDLLEDRDRRFGVSTAARRHNREDIATPDRIPGANAWQNGEVVQLGLS
jgi:hypothetical protein